MLPEIGDFIRSLGPLLPENEYRKIGTDIWVHKSAKVAPTIMMAGPMIICEGANVRHSAFLRGNVIIGAGAVVGNSCELKNALIFDEAQIPHFNYVGDSVLGYKAHMGAGAVTSNVKSDKSLVVVHAEDKDVATGSSGTKEESNQKAKGCEITDEPPAKAGSGARKRVVRE